MTAPGVSTCAPWADVGDLCAPCDDYVIDAGLLADGLQMASDILFDLTGRRWPGECTDLIRPCCSCGSPQDCGCGSLSMIELPGHPVVDVVEVKIDGVVVDPARYRVDDHRWLVYLPESDSAERQSWPSCQRLDRADTEEDTFSVEYLYGQAPPIGGIWSAATLACQLVLSCDPAMASQCRLPKRVTTITRQGVTLAVIDPLTLFPEGMTGLPEVDLWIASTRFGSGRRGATVFVPSRAPGERRAYT